MVSLIKHLNAVILMGSLLLLNASAQAAHNHQKMLENTQSDKSQIACANHDISCVQTVTSAFAPNGDLWRVWAIDNGLFYQISQDNGKTFADVQQISTINEEISARNENRPKIGFDNQQGVYLSWAMPREKKFTADIRFSYSTDYGKSFSAPMTINNDNLLAGHSFNEMLVSKNGDVNIVWLDGRLSAALKMQGKESKGSALYYANFNARQNEQLGKIELINQQLANDTCVCCRIAMDFNQQDELAIFWRHVYGDNIREFALLTLHQNAPLTPIQISQDYWKIDGCPHQGGGISIDNNNQYHLVWFNLGEKGKGIFYARLANSTINNDNQSITTPVPVGDVNAQAAHPHIMTNGSVVDIVWTQFDGIEHQLWHQRSIDHGKSFAQANVIAKSTGGSDRPFIIKKADTNFVSWHKQQQGHWIKVL